MGPKALQPFDNSEDGILSISGLGFQFGIRDADLYPMGGLFASVGQVGMNFGISPNSPNPRDSNGGGSGGGGGGNSGGGGGIKLPNPDLLAKYVSSGESVRTVGEAQEEEGVVKKKGHNGLKLKIKVRNPSLRRLISGAVAGAFSRTAVAPLETIRTHLMVGSSGNSSTEVFHNIMQTDGWKGLFRGNLVNVIRVAPSKAIEVQTLLQLRVGWYICLHCHYLVCYVAFVSYAADLRLRTHYT